MAVNPLFAGYATRVAFNINLSKTQITYLHYVALWEAMEKQPPEPRRGSYDEPHVFVPSVRSLIEKGLVEHNPKQASGYLSHLDPVDRMRAKAKDPDTLWCYRLTEAGWHVHALLVIAGLASEIYRPIDTQEPSKRKKKQNA